MSPWQTMMDDDRNGVAHEVLARLGDRWSVCVIHMIEGEPVRFTDLQRRISAGSPISARVLTRTLKHLERDGLIARKVFPVIRRRRAWAPDSSGASSMSHCRCCAPRCCSARFMCSSTG